MASCSGKAGALKLGKLDSVLETFCVNQDQSHDTSGPWFSSLQNGDHDTYATEWLDGANGSDSPLKLERAV